MRYFILVWLSKKVWLAAINLLSEERMTSVRMAVVLSYDFISLWFVTRL